MFKYIGPGFITGIPARDLTDAEVAEIGRKRIKVTGLYKEIKVRKSRETSEKSGGANLPEEAQWQQE